MNAEQGPTVDAVVDEHLGNSSYLVDLGDGRALAVDPPREVRALRARAERAGLRIAYAADTHLHADFLSGARQLAAETGAQILASAAGRRTFEHRALGDEDEVDLGGLTLRALTTPGHTDEHLAFLLADGSRPVGVFTGGSLIVGAAARTDLLGADRTEELARTQYASLRRLAQLPDRVAVWPTHGAGSFCSAPPGAERTSTIGREKATNPLLTAPDAETFVARLTGSLGRYPAYFDRLAELNRRGPAVVADRPALPPLNVDQVRALPAEGAIVVDVRPVGDFAAGHIPGAISIPLRAQFGTWLGWLLDPATPIIIVRDPDQDATDICWQALTIGYENLAGELTDGITAWHAAGHPLTTLRLVKADQLAHDGPAPVMDVRQDAEYTAGHLPAAQHVELGALPQRAADLDRAPYVVMCGHGERAATAASLLARAGHHDLSVLVGGVDDWAKVSGRPLETGR
ncbi:MBL fold metallo-hydrolase [Actinomadura madurae]|uniref:MBL fold metallo-hydrolase n=1 Tax=Actinomadura madurae TaxID=1993 RepID=UPI0020D2335C|nr:MBL fold metallo-hydrolase [Actinomadura madurae]MCP9952702.1 MBL fold metallo-hydrolase [Actinomadura madurae]MCP9969467.1 MBL fold metallo-hydrolase [Actinomadura madurae]MCP9981922.1 MBL fold metallo-hydrolase [Actinomadura madurae]MCQ0006551.1 MBL fold metallo-hydrolase [Actinomadura madurae]MCQ0018154.1 MBL fold metallo-hydrolase [Actinomadura madurae]